MMTHRYATQYTVTLRKHKRQPGGKTCFCKRVLCFTAYKVPKNTYCKVRVGSISSTLAGYFYNSVYKHSLIHVERNICRAMR